MKLPELTKEFNVGNFAIYFSAGAFRDIFSEMATEMTARKNTKNTDSRIIPLLKK